MYDITVQRATSASHIPSDAQLKKWATLALTNKISAAEITLRIVDKEEMKILNSTYRQKNKPTNVLSFPFELPKELQNDIPLLGDIIICAEIIFDEAKEQHKSLDAHWAHMVIHGTLHLLGFDHEKDDEADIMESEEIAILAKLNFPNPYQMIER